MEGSVQAVQALFDELQAMQRRIAELEEMAAVHHQMFMHEKEARNTLEAELHHLQEVHEASAREQSIREITRREQAREFETVFETLTDALAVYDKTGRIVRMNKAFHELLSMQSQPSYSSQPIIERGASLAVRDEQDVPLPAEHWPVHRILKGETLTSNSITDIIVSTLDGRKIQLNVSGAPMRNEQGDVVGAVAIYRDVTERRKLERERLLQERAEAHANELALLEVNRRTDEFLSIASHELRTPLTTINGNIQLAKRRLKTLVQEEAQEHFVEKLDLVQELLNRAERQVRVQNRLVGDLLDVSRIQSNRLELQMEHLDLAAIVSECVEDRRATAPPRMIALHLASEETVPIFADHNRIFQVVTNYLTNALKYSPAESPVAVCLSVREGMAHLSVRDQGPGLPPDEQQRVWQRFYRAPGIVGQGGSGVGLGLGLYICRTIIELHRGQVGVESIPGEGATFWFTLPLA